MTIDEFEKAASGTLAEFVQECKGEQHDCDEPEWWWWSVLAAWCVKPPDMGPFDGNQN